MALPLLPRSIRFVAVTFLVAGLSASGRGATASAVGPGSEPAVPDVAQTSPYGRCPDPITYCPSVHPGSVTTAYCAFGRCFDMSYGDEARVVAADELGPFPKKGFVWHEGTMTPSSCQLTTLGNKVRIVIPESSIKCRVDLGTTNHLYYEHFVSNPATGCLGWVECRVY